MIALLNSALFRRISGQAPGSRELRLINPTDGLC
jgi:hypothetical protein